MKTLVIVICQTRAHKTVWPSFKKNVLDSLGADLALCVAKTASSDAFRENAKYIWEYEDPTNWASAYDEIQAELGVTTPWRQVLDIDPGRDSCLFGGIKHPYTIGSGAVLFYYRWKALEQIKRLGLQSTYDWFIITRSDYMYPVPHVPLDLLSTKSVWIPNGEKYGGVTDRHLICPSAFLEKSIDMLRYILTEPDHLLSNYKRWLNGKGANPETFIAYYLEKQEVPIQFVPYFMYTVRELDEIPNRTHYGLAGRIRHGTTNYGIKYPAEKQSADTLSIRTSSDWRAYLADTRI
jgi:hypothetical protein